MGALTYREFRAQHPVSQSLMQEAQKATEEIIRTYELREARKECHMTQEQLSQKMSPSHAPQSVRADRRA